MAGAETTDWQREWTDLNESAARSVAEASSLDDLESVRVALLGRKGRLTTLLKGLKDLPISEKRVRGPQANTLKSAVSEAIEAKRAALERAGSEESLEKTRIDLSLPAEPAARGRLHPVTATIAEITGVLERLGFGIADGPLVETDYYNFSALNIPADHPARDMQDTFYLKQAGRPLTPMKPGRTGLSPRQAAERPLLMRTHTSPVQIRHLEKHPPPVRIIVPGRVFRHEAVDAGHSAVFHQIEGLYVDRRVTMADLKATLRAFLRKLFGDKTKMRFRPSYFPFTEPSAEIDVQCLLCGGKASAPPGRASLSPLEARHGGAAAPPGRCGPCKGTGWLEMLGAGVVNPLVLKGVGIDPEIWSGFAFGVGVERIAMLRYGIPDIRMFYENDIRFLEQLGA